MFSKFKITGSSLIALCFLVIAFVTNLVVLIVNSLSSNIVSIQDYRNEVMPLNILDFVKSALLLLMGFLLFRIVKNVMSRIKWNMSYYKKIKSIAWLNVFVLVIDSFTSFGRDIYLVKNESLLQHIRDTNLYTEVILKTLFSSPASWFLILCVFLIADILQYANQVKIENDSII